MERAPLRPVPSRPAGPIAPDEAVSYVAGELPGLDEAAAAALALVALVGRPRPELVDSPDLPEAADLSAAALAEALFRARRALRRRLYPLPGSGWCERAERLISDRLDDALEGRGPARLEVHLANCSRCVEHERRLGQAHEALVAGFVGTAAPVAQPEAGPPSPPETPSVDPPPAVLRAVETPMLPPPSSDADQLPPPESPQAEDAPQIEKAPEVEEPPAATDGPAAVPAARRLPTSPLWTPGTRTSPRPAPPARPPVRAPEPPAPRVQAPSPPPVSTPTVPTTPPQNPPSDPPTTPPSASAWAAPPSSAWPSTSSPAAWRSDRPAPVLAARTALETESEWGAVGALVAVLGVAVVVGLLAVLLAAGA